MANNNQQDIRYLAPVAVDNKKKKYCRFKKAESNTLIIKTRNF